MTREGIVARVRDLAGPLGPFQSFDEQLQQTDEWLQSLGEKALDQLLDLIVTPASADELRGVENEIVMAVIGELLCRVAEMRPAESVPRLVAYLSNDHVRPFVADALGSSGSPEGQREAAAYVTAHPDLPADEMIPLVEAVAEVGGPETAALLRAVRDSLGDRTRTQPVRDRINELLK